MPVELCPKCKKLHYVPGACPEPRIVNGSIARATVTPLPKPSAKKRENVDDQGRSRGENQQGAGLSAPSGKKRPAPRASKPKAGPASPGKVMAKESRAKATKGKAEMAGGRKAPLPDGVASRPSDTAEVLQGAPVEAARAAIQTAEVAAAHLAPVTTRGTPRQRAPKGTFDRKAYQRAAAKKRRDKLKGAP